MGGCGSISSTHPPPISKGCNVENAAYPLGCCAERTAIYAAVSKVSCRCPCRLPLQGGDRARETQGERDIVAIVVSTDVEVPSCLSERKPRRHLESRRKITRRTHLSGAVGGVRARSSSSARISRSSPSNRTGPLKSGRYGQSKPAPALYPLTALCHPCDRHDLSMHMKPPNTQGACAVCLLSKGLAASVETLITSQPIGRSHGLAA